MNGEATAVPLRLGIVATHPIQYQAPLFRALNSRPGVAVEVLYLCEEQRTSFDAGFGRSVAWDVDLFDGYQYTFANSGSPSVGSLKRWIREHHLQVLMVHGHSSAAMLKTSALARMLRIPYLLRGEAHAAASATGARGWVRDAVAGSSVRLAAAALPVGRLNCEFYKKYGARATYFSPYSVDNDRFREAAHPVRSDPVRRRLAVKELGLPSDRPLAVFSGKLQPWKRPLDVVDAIRRLDGAVGLLFIGEGPLRGDIEAAARGLPIALTGFVNQEALPRLYALGDAMVLPSEREPWGLVVNEGMACGLLPITSHRVGCNFDLVDGVGSVYECGDVDGLVSTLRKRLIEGTPDAQAIRRRISRYSLDAAAQGIEQAARAVVPRR